MDQPDKKQFAKKSYVDLFLRSCLGRFIIIGILTAIVLFVAKATVPSKAKMEAEMNDDKFCKAPILKSQGTSKMPVGRMLWSKAIPNCVRPV